MHVLVIRHHRIDEAGFIASAFAARGARLSTHLFPAGGPLPPLDGVDHVVVLGADFSVYDERVAGRVGPELDWLRAADAAGVPVLGICYGAQALTAALGGTVEAAPRSEIGWLSVDSCDPDLIEPGPWLEFHGDRCLPPPGARVLARTPLCVQAFSAGPHLAVQFHPEVDGGQVARWLEAGGAAAARAAGQDPGELVARSVAEEPAAAARADRLVTAALRLAGQWPDGGQAAEAAPTRTSPSADKRA